ncbi:hypothetical protein MARI_12720 [Marinobacter sp. JH2]|nr:hypothetical protein [Marinobacter sp. JH2]QBM17166.1 hypothetical protein MARI_12720 [Marinobacter sp. JH2]
MMRLSVKIGWFLTLALAIGLPVIAQSDTSGEPAPKPPLSVTGISLSSGEDDPRILYILPWRGPSLPRRPRADLNQELPELTRPVTATAMENHRLFRETLNPLVLEPTGVAPNRDKP